MAEKIEHPSTWVRTLDNETESPVDGSIIGEFIYKIAFSQSSFMIVFNVYASLREDSGMVRRFINT
jgi:hypothetical protein